MQIYCIKIEFQKVANFINTTADDKDLPRLVTKNWIKFYHQSRENYNVNKETRIKTSMLRSDLCDHSNAYIAVEGTITVVRPDNAKRVKATAFKNNAPYISCISKINGTKIGNVKDLDVVMPMYNLLEYSKNYRKQQEFSGIIIELHQVILFLLILNLVNIKQALQEILIMLLLGRKDMMQTKLVKMKLKLLFY